MLKHITPRSAVILKRSGKIIRVQRLVRPLLYSPTLLVRIDEAIQIALKIAGLFLEAHPEPEQALCDGPCALRLNQLEPFLKQMKAVDDLVKSFEALDTA